VALKGMRQQFRTGLFCEVDMAVHTAKTNRASPDKWRRGKQDFRGNKISAFTQTREFVETKFHGFRERIFLERVFWVFLRELGVFCLRNRFFQRRLFITITLNDPIGGASFRIANHGEPS
jgi:hypothetical protein